MSCGPAVAAPVCLCADVCPGRGVPTLARCRLLARTAPRRPPAFLPGPAARNPAYAAEQHGQRRLQWRRGRRGLLGHCQLRLPRRAALPPAAARGRGLAWAARRRQPGPFDARPGRHEQGAVRSNHRGPGGGGGGGHAAKIARVSLCTPSLACMHTHPPPPPERVLQAAAALLVCEVAEDCVAAAPTLAAGVGGAAAVERCVLWLEGGALGSDRGALQRQLADFLRAEPTGTVLLQRFDQVRACGVCECFGVAGLPRGGVEDTHVCSLWRTRCWPSCSVAHPPPRCA